MTVSSDQAGTRLDRLLAQAAPWLGRRAVRAVFEQRAARLVRGDRTRTAAAGERAVAGDLLKARLPALSSAAQPEPAGAVRVRLERPDLVVVDKPAGQATAPLLPGEVGTLANALVARYPEMAGVGLSLREPGLLHRLDAGTSGLLVAARSQAAFQQLRAHLVAGALDKRYQLVCAEADLADEGDVDLPLTASRSDRRRTCVWEEGRGGARHAALTSWRVLRREGDRALVEVRVSRGFRHQIRAHFASIGRPLVGDVLYGGAPVAGLERHALHASRLAFEGDAVIAAFDVTSELPPDLERLLRV